MRIIGQGGFERKEAGVVDDQGTAFKGAFVMMTVCLGVAIVWFGAGMILLGLAYWRESDLGAMEPR